MPVHLFGLPADLDPILQTARAHNLLVIEDAAQAIGSRYNDRFIGTIGDIGCFSFFPSKNLGGAGDGGLITTNDPALAERLRMVHNHGSKKKYFHDIIGTNSRLDALQAAVLRVKLPHLDKWAAGRQNRADRYRKLFEEKRLTSHITFPPVPPPNYHHVYNQFTIRARSRDQLKESLRLAGVPSEIYYPLSLHLQNAFKHLGYKPGDLPHSEKASHEVLSLPVFPELSDDLPRPRCQRHRLLLRRPVAATFRWPPSNQPIFPTANYLSRFCLSQLPLFPFHPLKSSSLV